MVCWSSVRKALRYSWSVIEGYGSEIRVQRYDFFKNYARVKMIIRSNCAKIAHHSFICHCYPLTESTNLSIKAQCDQPFSERHIYRLYTVYVPSMYRLCTVYRPTTTLPLITLMPPLYHPYATFISPLCHLYTTFIPLLKAPFLSALPIQNTTPYPIMQSLHSLHSGQKNSLTN